MAGDWIKMRSNLWDDPRVASLVDATDSSEAAVVGGLYWLWSTADQHTEDGVMPGLTLRQIDRKTGIPGFGSALVSIGWLRDETGGVVLENFTEHNGSSAKRRATDAQRKANVRNVSASDADSARTDAGPNAPNLGAREREEKEKSASTSVDAACATPGDACKAMKAVGLAGVNPSHPKLSALLAAGITVAELTAAALEAVQRQKTFPYALATAEGRRRGSATEPLPAAATADPDSRSAVEAEGIAKGIGPWSELNEQWPAYKARVRGAPAGKQLDLNALAGMAAQRAGAHA